MQLTWLVPATQLGQCKAAVVFASMLFGFVFPGVALIMAGWTSWHLRMTRCVYFEDITPRHFDRPREGDSWQPMSGGSRTLDYTLGGVNSQEFIRGVGSEAALVDHALGRGETVPHYIVWIHSSMQSQAVLHGQHIHSHGCN